MAERPGEISTARRAHQETDIDAGAVTWFGIALAGVVIAVAIATHVGLAIFEEPERFITADEPSPATPAALAA